MQWRAIGQLCDIPFNTLSCPFSTVPDAKFHSVYSLRVSSPASPVERERSVEDSESPRRC
jgi:hypothetical protein